MNDHRKTGALRLWALVLFLVVLAPSAFAQGTPETGFPFLSIDMTQLQSLRTAFMFQWGLFNGYNGGGAKALYYVALAAALVGALAIVFNQALHSTKVVASWLLICIVCLFAPYNSKLLFYPIQPPEAGMVKGQMPGGESKGFTPQLLAAHVGTTLQVIFTDMFNSAGFRGLVDGMEAETQLALSPASCPHSKWGEDVNKLSQCGISPLPMSLQNGGAGAGGEATPPANVERSTSNLMQTLDDIRKYYGRDRKDFASFQTPPPVMMLYDTAEEIPGSKETYFAQMSKLYNHIFAPTTPACIGCDGGMTYDKAASDLAALGEKQRSLGAVDSFTFYLMKKSQADGGSFQQAMETALYRKCGENSVAQQSKTLCDPVVNAVSKQFVDGDKGGLIKPTQGAAMHNDRFGRIMRLLNADEEANGNLSSMASEQLLMPAGSGGQAVRSSDNCSPAFADNVFGRIFADKQAHRQDYIPPKLQQYVNGGGMPAPGEWSADDLKSASTATGTAAGWFGLNDGTNSTMANNYATYLNGNKNFKEAYDAAGGDPKKQQLALANAIVGFSKSSCDALESSQRSVAAYGEINQTRPSQVGAVSDSLIGRGVSWLVEKLGMGATIIAGQFAGIFAGAIINIMRAIVDLMLMMVILITPIAFLFGIAMPNHAMGLLVQSVLIVGILKLVPVTFVVIDRMGEVIYTAIGLVGSSWFDTAFKQAVFHIGIATIYTGLVGMTMFLIFKVGDPGNIQKLTELDKAANEVADTGKKIAAAIGVVAGLATGGAIAGAFGGSAAKKVMQDQAMKSLGGRMGAAGALMQAAREEMNKLDADGAKAAADGRKLTDEQLAYNRAKEMFKDEHGIDPVTDSELGTVAFGQDMLMAGGSADDVRNMIKGNGPVGVPSYASGSIGPVTPPGWTPPGSGGSGGGGPGGGGNQGGGGPAGPTPEQRVAAEEAARASQGVPSMQGQPGQSVGQMTVGSLVVGGQGGNPQLGTAQAGTAQMTGGQTTATGTNITATGTTRTQPGQVDPELGVRRPAGSTDAEWDATVAGYAKIKVDQAEAFANIDAMLKSGDAVGAAKARYDLFAKIQNEAAAQYADVKAGKLTGDFKAPGVWTSMKSGFYGGLEAGGGIGDLPYVGKILKGATNEFQEAPERARAWMNVGGKAEFKKLKDAAKRGGFYDEMMGHVGKGTQYQQGAGLGNQYFQGAVAGARQQASEAAAKQYDIYQAQKTATKGVDGAVRGTGQEFFTAEELRGAQVSQALKSVMQTKQMAAQIQGGTLKVAGGEIVLTADALRELAGSKATKAVSGELNEMMANHYYLMEKDGRDAYQTQGRTRNDSAAIHKFIREDIDTDYMVESDYKRFTGKRAFFGQREMVKAFLQLEGLEMQAKNDLKLQLSSAAPSVRAKLNQELDELKLNGPLSRIYNQSATENYNNAVTSSWRAKGWQQDQKDLNSSLRHLDREAAYGKNFDSGVSNLAKFMRAFGLNASNVDAAEAFFDQFRHQRHSRNIFSEENVLTKNGEAYLRRAMEESGFSADEVTRFITELHNRGNRF